MYYSFNHLKIILSTPDSWRPLLLCLIAKLIGRRSIIVNNQGIKHLVQLQSFGIGLWSSVSGESYEPELPIFLSKIKADSIVLDLGANVGTFSLKAAKITQPNGKVIAVEPIPFIFDNLKTNVRLNGFQNIVLINAAAADKDGEAKLNLGINYHTSSSIVRAESGNSILVKTVSIDNVLKLENIPKLDLIKMDIEGAEYLAIRGMKEALIKYRPLILFENNFQARTELEAIGYECGFFNKNDKWVSTKDGFNLWARPI
jgi:FkbM family methyltransferase